MFPRTKKYTDWGVSRTTYQLFIVNAVNKDRKKGVHSVASKHPAAGAAESCSIHYNVKPSLEVRADRNASMPYYQIVEKKIAAIPRM